MKKTYVWVWLLAFALLFSACTNEPAEATEANGADAAATDAADGTDSQTAQEFETDILVIGAGGTGLSAASAAVEAGAEVMVLEKQGIIGGSTALSGGGIAAPGTRFQEELGIEDSKEDWRALWEERQATGRENPIYPDYERVDLFMDRAIDTTHWMTDVIGQQWDRVEGFGFDPVERLHFPETNGSDLTTSLANFLSDKGVEVMMETTATSLLTDDAGAVTGAVAETKDGEITIHAKKVILGTGGFARNEEMIAELVPEMEGTAETTVAGGGSHGDGIRMALEVGAVLYEEPWIIGLGIGNPNPETSALNWDVSKMYVNQDGERFFNEANHYAIVTNEVAAQEKVWMLLDSSEANAEILPALDGIEDGTVVTGEDLAALAEAMGVDAAALEQTAADYNAGIESDADAFGKPAAAAQPLGDGPYYAVEIRPVTMGTFGGVKTNDNFEVLDEEGNPIPNLYAGGETANKFLYNQVYMSGSAVQHALTSGRIAGEHAAANLE